MTRHTSRCADAFSIEALRALARRRLPRAVFDFFDGGAEDERALRANREAFGKHVLMPRVLRDVNAPSLDTSILGAPSALPLAIAPTGAVGFGWRGGDIAIASAAARHDIPYALSTSATASIEEIAQVAKRRWFQAYILKDRAATLALIERAAASGYEALMITVDLPVGGKRERDLRNHFSIPFRYTARNLLDFASRPAWSIPMLVRGVPQMPNLQCIAAKQSGATSLASSVGRSYDPSFDWRDLAEIRRMWQGKLIVKGIVHPDDARRAVDLGVDAIVVSNHGGRQLDVGPATLDALPGVVAAAGTRVDVLVDGGIRRGSDIVIALALGAKAVLVGRATLYGACAGGEAGAMRALDILTDELRRTLQLCGIERLADVGPELLA
ncbi:MULTISPECIES: alpha-hydroxy acid oxidase [Paraburkholderia]|uniref:alpha-hydroxy acid oxidase n=1 Tax=Paraburkholderia TaxID=1822464 RepID=UPI0022598220|nr:MULTISPECIES: alpha-hydroxy acid oxidase [Paraburkholderia]MCX4160011.1 alpha-hydroxy acid oxidase [Paraburkholderia megapolitana]MDN7155511.1 alpha-hydroxy-acid oxidizing protein [Paraburkholderia sp. CHISQ3]MDQ6492555.1 alpha-hydroxy-acid oxidizing protein [Paraburkholderia megapolitana]